MHIHLWALRYGMLFYPLVFAWTFVEGESVVILSGAASRHGYIDLRLIIVSAWLGSFMGDQLWFYLSRRYGTRLLKRHPGAANKIARATERLARHATLFIFSYRFIYGLRNVASLAIGASSITWRKFAVLNFFSAGLWACTFGYGGYLMGSALSQFMDHVAGWVTLAAAAAVCAAAAAACVVSWRRRRHARMLREIPLAD
jgi:membrane protein DedA with SNARE-associated domain